MSSSAYDFWLWKATGDKAALTRQTRGQFIANSAAFRCCSVCLPFKRQSSCSLCHKKGRMHGCHTKIPMNPRAGGREDTGPRSGQPETALAEGATHIIVIANRQDGQVCAPNPRNNARLCNWSGGCTESDHTNQRDRSLCTACRLAGQQPTSWTRTQVPAKDPTSLPYPEGGRRKL